MLGANFTVESIMTDLCREIISVSSLVLDLNNHFIDAMFMEIDPPLPHSVRSAMFIETRAAGPHSERCEVFIEDKHITPLG